MTSCSGEEPAGELATNFLELLGDQDDYRYPTHGMLATPPSDDEMAAWLYPIISHGDQKPAVGDDDVVKQNDRPVVSSVKATMNKQLKEKRLSTTPKKNLARRRRCKINEKLKTLQQMVPGCEPSQASTLDQTIHYVRSLQNQVQAMSVVGCSLRPPVPASIGPPPPPMMVPFVPILPCPAHHPAAIHDAATGAVDLPASSSCTGCWWPSSSSGLQ
ncbi:hypothetical protein BRADI_4g02673v3 [Brachypodium distachyon]|uniref:BHLH domain-containing protein n=1 Tax=Brachypodium distachyon TaxID=15368 RepID=A0A0Q3EI22_BRADI|nr:hypothetical protein BRADI_4g02673v3 [Brachypodium distachyon]